MVADADRRRRQFWLDPGAFRSDRHRQCGDGQMYPRQRRARAGRTGFLSAFLHGEREESDSRKPDDRQCKDRDRWRPQRAARPLLTILYGLLTNPDQLDAVRAGGKWRSAFEEGVRWVAPIQASSRLVMEDTEIRGCFLPKGDNVMTIQAWANRDEDAFEDGENYNGLREPNPHQAFGNGPHHCAGAHLSRRTVGAILLPMLFERFPTMTLPDPASVRWHGFGFRGPLNLPVLLQ